MKPSSIAKALNVAIERKRPVFLWGAPGVGKSEVVAQVAQARDVELRDVRLSLLDPVDLKGFPVPNTKTKQMNWLPADFLPTSGEGVLFLDEMNSAPPSVQAAAYQLVLNGRIGDYQLPEGWSIIAAGNRDSDRSVTHRMPAALANRFVHLDFEVHVDDWCDWAIKNDVNLEVLSFIRFRTNLLHSFDPQVNPRAFPSPRSWSFVDNLIKSGLPHDIELEMLKGTVGEGAAGEFMAFVEVFRELPNPDEILVNPEGVPVPEKLSTLYALTTSLAARATRDNFDIIMKYGRRLQTEFQVVLVRDAVRRQDDISKAKAFTTWALENRDVLM